MPPLPFEIDTHARGTMLRFTVKRDLAEALSNAMGYSENERDALQVIDVTFASISMSAAILSFYWFRKMRRSFRHDLIMFLIQSDLFKALGFMLAPIVAFTFGPLKSSSTFCQVDGFIISLGIEASDFAVLMIAIHSALSIFQLGTTAGEGGLYPYRHIAFAVWIIFPVLMASLAFLNPNGGYVVGGTSCYLPMRPAWYSLALSWIPRYIIFLVIIAVYASIYFYVQRELNGFRGGSNAGASLSTESAERRGGNRLLRPLKHKLPPTPPLAYHGLISESRHASLMQEEARKLSASTIKFYNYPSKTIGRTTLPRSYSIRFDGNQSRSSADDLLIPPAKVREVIGVSSSAPDLNDMTPMPSPTYNPPSTPTSWTTFAARYTGRAPSVIDFLSFLRVQSHRPSTSSWASTPIYRLEVVNSQGQDVAASDMARDKIRRQLRFLFIYPLVYIGLWVIPFIGNVLRYDETLNTNPPFALTTSVSIIMTSQCTVDCFLFSIREKPWRHIPGSKGGFWESLAFWRVGDSRLAKQQSGPGKSRAEMAAEARAAYRRRDEEMAARVSETDQRASGDIRRERTERSWWDVSTSVDGMISPVVEEIDPFDAGGNSPS